MPQWPILRHVEARCGSYTTLRRSAFPGGVSLPFAKSLYVNTNVIPYQSFLCILICSVILSHLLLNVFTEINQR